ncbi:MAG TPA: hypothetical protein EYO33_03395 [Phycisphaerales bacterium]|nr:hypothetical protein [Phycisphaerales bacterium]
MSTSLIRLQQTLPQSEQWGREEWGLFRASTCPEANDAQLKQLIYHCVRTGLCPFRKQIYLVIRKGKGVIQTGIDGFIQIAQDTGEYEGLAYTYWCGKDKVWHDVWDIDNGFPMAAKVGVWRKGFRDALPMVAHWHNYFPKNPSEQWMWKQMPERMIAKCATALALRTAFQALDGLYTDDEMAQSIPVEVTVEESPEQPVTRTGTQQSAEQIKGRRYKYLRKLASKKWSGMNEAQLDGLIRKFAEKRKLLAIDPATRRASVKLSTPEQLEALIAELSKWRPPANAQQKKPAQQPEDVEEAEYTQRLTMDQLYDRIETLERHLSQIGMAEERGQWQARQIQAALKQATKLFPGVPLGDIFGPLNSSGTPIPHKWNELQLHRWMTRLERLAEQEASL